MRVGAVWTKCVNMFTGYLIGTLVSPVDFTHPNNFLAYLAQIKFFWSRLV